MPRGKTAPALTGFGIVNFVALFARGKIFPPNFTKKILYSYFNIRRAHTTNNIKAGQTMEKARSLAFLRPAAPRNRAHATVLGAMHSESLIADERCAKCTLSATESTSRIAVGHTRGFFEPR